MAVGTKLVCDDCRNVHDYMTMPTDEDNVATCPDCECQEFTRLDKLLDLEPK